MSQARPSRPCQNPAFLASMATTSAVPVRVDRSLAGLSIPGVTHTHSTPMGSYWGFLSRIRSQPSPTTSPNQICLSAPELPRARKVRSWPRRCWGIEERRLHMPASPRARQGQIGTPGVPAGPPRAPAQGHPARGGRSGGAEPDLPAADGGGTARGLPTARWRVTAGARGRQGAGGCGAGRALGKGGVGARGRGLGGVRCANSDRGAGLRPWQPARS
jgi:hypothetical protein